MSGPPPPHLSGERRPSIGGTGSGEALRAPAGPPRTPHPSVPESLRGLYERYCDRQAAELLSLLPQAAIRPFYARAARWAGARRGEVGDPLALARQFARHLLPLPPYEAWVPEYLSHRQAYLEALQVPAAPRREEPVAVAIRTFGEGWYAALCLVGAEDGWRGFLQFHRAEGVRSVRTADIFRGEDAGEIRERFDGFDDATLRAFLRSVLP